jgi:ectoine hydroxylase-related dioxygenase (phytanoyl-CoA dioxygenase family)
MTGDIAPTLEANGWSAAEPLLSLKEAQSLIDSALSIQNRLSRPRDWQTANGEPNFAERPWFKSLHAISSAWFDLGSHPTIVARLRSILGDNILLWGAALIVRAPGQDHRWHVDVEHLAWPGASVFVGLSGVQAGLSGLKFVSGSHRIGQAPLRTDSDDSVLYDARSHDPACVLDYPAIADGEFLLFSGAIWHGSFNRTDRVRYGALLQYTAPSARTAIPLSWHPPITWSRHAPPCALVAGRDEFGINQVIGRPQLTSCVGDPANV